MAFSMFFRAPACTSRVFSQQIMRLATQQATKPIETQRMLSSIMPLQTSFLKSDTTPILNAVRSFRTSPALLHEEKAHDHSKLWVIEKLTSAALVPLIPICLMIPNKIFDSVLAILITAHSFWGLEAIVVEYVRVLLVGVTIPKIAMGVVYFLTVLMLGGLFFLIFNDIGLCRGFWRIWRNMRKPKDQH
ncbi:succinate dehydrogenase [ubiquinone] cytochrome b small subunit, mitochondrial isoform X2 [Pieris brassicae]|uniref:succinate dehydrogenase [ubiquinone] cytochrome b small subunit, mitochondrial isoform X2 n=1 Tax=Pieris brassicae TaxID=7116 RepID=UPI001E65E260|nr:succinate dehydrogenase [ubiquinone] cytochrome b small subunit, mitochondrial isoform X2 [Pieris brassicae]